MKRTFLWLSALIFVVLGGTATGFNNPGTDTFAGTNVMSVVVEVPKTLLKSTGKINVWLQTKQKN